MNNKKINITGVILDILQHTAEVSAGMLYIMLASRPESYRRARKILMEGPPTTENKWSDWYIKRENFQKLLSKLKKEGFVDNIKNKGTSSLVITEKGKERLKKIKSKINNLPWVREKRKSKNPVIISYDIPEDLRRHRFWLREVLKFLDYLMVHKSVWVGNTILPKEFMKELRDREVLDYVHIFEVTQQGTLDKVS